MYETMNILLCTPSSESLFTTLKNTGFQLVLSPRIWFIWDQKKDCEKMKLWSILSEQKRIFWSTKDNSFKFLPLGIGNKWIFFQKIIKIPFKRAQITVQYNERKIDKLECCDEDYHVKALKRNKMNKRILVFIQSGPIRVFLARNTIHTTHGYR